MACHWDMDVSENSGTPKSSILMGVSIINHPFWDTPIFGNTHINIVTKHIGIKRFLVAFSLRFHDDFGARKPINYSIYSHQPQTKMAIYHIW